MQNTFKILTNHYILDLVDLARADFTGFIHWRWLAAACAALAARALAGWSHSVSRSGRQSVADWLQMLTRVTFWGRSTTD